MVHWVAGTGQTLWAEGHPGRGRPHAKTAYRMGGGEWNEGKVRLVVL